MRSVKSVVRLSKYSGFGAETRGGRWHSDGVEVTTIRPLIFDESGVIFREAWANPWSRVFSGSETVRGADAGDEGKPLEKWAFRSS